MGVNVAVAAILLAVATGYVWYRYQSGRIHRIDLPTLSRESAGANRVFTVLVVGSDSRAGLTSPADQSSFGSPSSQPSAHSDSMMLLEVEPATRRLQLMSLPRDMAVLVPGRGIERLEAVYQSGPNLLVRTIESDFGVPINHYVQLDFTALERITDAVGGVHLYFPTPARDLESDLAVPRAGCVDLTGAQALAFVR
jgi:LCP family protein required for cell wall assembly